VISAFVFFGNLKMNQLVAKGMPLAKILDKIID
jgi:hypothetical protein